MIDLASGRAYRSVMRRLVICSIGLLLAIAVGAAETRTEVTRATTPEQDLKANSAAVQEVYAIPSKMDRVLVLRFKYPADLLEGLEAMVKKEKINNAVILSAIGSVRGYHYHTVSNRTFPSKDMFVRNADAPADIVSMSGYILGGRVHAHILFASPDKAFGGHLEKGTEVFTFAVVTVGILDDALDLSRVDDKTLR